MKYKTIDLCAGIGGIRRGFELTGRFQNVLSAEIDPYAVKTYQHLFGDNPYNDITTDKFKEMVCSIAYDVLLAGFPCQTFSRAGKQLGFADETKGTIFYELADIIRKTRPKALFLENVENLVSHDQKRTMRTIIKILESELHYRVIGVEIGEKGEFKYSAKSFVRNSKYFGIPQNRPRAYIMAFNKEIYGNAIKRLNGNLPEHGTTTIFANVNEILEKDVDERYYMASGYLETLKKHKKREKEKGNGFGYCVVNQKEDLIANTILATGGSGKERNLIYQPKPEVAVKKVKGKRTEINAEGIRIMTPTEWGRLQGFIGYAFMRDGQETFEFPEGTPESQKYKQFGNSVTIPVIEAMAKYMLACFDELEKNPVDVITALTEHKGYIKTTDLLEIIDIEPNKARYIFRKLCEDGVLKQVGTKRATKYQLQ